ncbi:hypothetical protein VTK73DRAFT_5858 [Phialemonium thermophilum]|uniref:CBM-cenC domain-containing protein n=1 Tax=Phialemonium thermophilum TaxID=223376 RepID=A0ABR3WLX5_9PEZI
MRNSISYFLASVLVSGVGARCTSPSGSTKCNADNCLRAVRGTPLIGAPFCSSWLSQSPVTTTVTETATATETLTDVVTVSTTQTLTTSTFTDVVATATVTQLVKRKELDPSASIYSRCSSLSSRVSSACSCFLSTTSTLTVTATVTATVTSEVAVTTTDVITSHVVATVSTTRTATATSVVTQVVDNGSFESYKPRTNPTIAPWTNSTSWTGGSITVANGVTTCGPTSTGYYCAPGTVAVMMRPPTTPGGYVSLLQNLQYAKPGTTYTLSYWVRCLHSDLTSTVTVLFNGDSVGSYTCADTGTYFTLVEGILLHPVQPVPGGTNNLLEVRFVNGGGLPSLYGYVDAFQAVPVS